MFRCAGSTVVSYLLEYHGCIRELLVGIFASKPESNSTLAPAKLNYKPANGATQIRHTQVDLASDIVQNTCDCLLLI